MAAQMKVGAMMMQQIWVWKADDFHGLGSI
jgi:hypothetical protein